MKDRELGLQKAADLFTEAALGLANWTDALFSLAQVVNSRTGQLIGFGSYESLPFNVMTEMAETAAQEFAQCGGANPLINSRVRVGTAAPELALRDDRDFTVELDKSRSPEFAKWQEDHRVGYTCLTTLIRHDRYIVGLAAINDSNQAPMNDKDRRSLSLLAPALRRAVRLQMNIEGRQAALIAQAFDAIDRAIFVCSADGYVVAMSSQAEELVRSARHLSVCKGQLVLTDPAANNSLKRELCLLSTNDLESTAKLKAIVAHDKSGFPIMIECSRFAFTSDLPMLAHSIVVVHAPNQREEHISRLARVLYGLTPTEAQVAAYVCSGLGPKQIAEQCEITVGTVRTHLRHIFDKSGARGQAGLVAKLSAYL